MPLHTGVGRAITGIPAETSGGWRGNLPMPRHMPWRTMAGAHQLCQFFPDRTGDRRSSTPWLAIGTSPAGSRRQAKRARGLATPAQPPYPRVSPLRLDGGPMEVPACAAQAGCVPGTARSDLDRRPLSSPRLVYLPPEPGDVPARPEQDAGSLRQDGFHRHGGYHHERHGLVLGRGAAGGLLSGALRPAACRG